MDTAEALKQLGCATLHESQGQRGALDAGIKPLDPAMKLAGPALTVYAPPGDNLMIHQAMRIARAGEVLVVSSDGYVEGGPWGDVLTLAAQVRGLAGLVIDGSVRDSEAIVAMRFPAFSRGISIKGTAKSKVGTVNATIQCGGVVVEPGDWIVGDRDGVVVVRAAEVDAVIRAARQREAKEEALRAAIRNGATTLDLLGLEALPGVQPRH